MNVLKERLRDMEPVVGSWLSIGHPAVAELMAMSEFDFVLIDMEHTPISVRGVQRLVRAIEATDGPTTPVVRVPAADPMWVQRVLDTGVTNVMVPKVDTPEEAAEFVDNARYPPEGTRGIAGSRATGYGRSFEEYVSSVNDDVLVIAQIETKSGIDNAAEIAGTDGITALFVGPADLSGALGRFGQKQSDAYAQAVRAIIECAHQHDVPTGTFSSDETGVRRGIDRGFDFAIAGKDASHLVAGCRSAKTAFFEAVAERPDQRLPVSHRSGSDGDEF